MNGKNDGFNFYPAQRQLWDDDFTTTGQFSAKIIYSVNPHLATWCETSGKVTAVFKWIPSGPDDHAPPTVLAAKITASARAEGIEDAILTVDNGIGGKTSTTFIRQLYEGRYYSKKQEGTVYKQIETKGATLVRIPLSGVNLKARAEIAALYPKSPNNFIVELSLKAENSNYWVRIKSDIEDSYVKSNDAPPGTPPGTEGPFPAWRKKIERKDDGSMEVHSAVKWDQTITNLPDYEFLFSQIFSAETGGFSSPNYQWSVSGLGAFNPSQSMNWRTREAQVNCFLGTTPSEHPGSTTMELFVTGGTNDPTISNSYTVVWHRPYEEWQPSAQWDDAGWTLIPINADPGSADGGKRITVTVRSVPFWLSALYYTGQAATFIAMPEASVPAQMIFASLGFTLQELKPTPETYDEQDTMSHWDVAAQATREGDTRITPPELAYKTALASKEEAWYSCTWSPLDWVKYRHHTFNGDEYNSNGYKGPVSCEVRQPFSRGIRHIYTQKAVTAPTPPLAP